MEMRGSETTILVVDDDSALQRLLAKWLENAGYRVRTAGSGRAAIEEIEADCPGILITDWEMPDIDGLELCRWIRGREMPRYIYSYLLTMRTGTTDIVKGLEAGADDFLKKPVDRNELLARMRSGTRVLDLETRLNESARRDSLTGLLTQRAFFDSFRQEWKRATRYGSPVSCVILDIDHFKRINDEHGHLVGDRAIRGTASWLMRNTRSSDVVSRFGGDEFCVLLAEATEAQAVQWAERARASLEESSASFTNEHVPFTASFGIAQRMDDTPAPDRLVDMADQAMLVAKQAGRNRVLGYQGLFGLEIRSPASTPTRLMKNVLARDAMTPVVAGLSADSPIGNAAEYLLNLRMSSAPVVDDASNLVGTLSEKGVLEALLADHGSGRTVRDVMSSNVVWYDELTPLLTIYEFLGRVSLRSVVIVRDRRPVGVISRGVILRWCINTLMSAGHASPSPPESGGSDRDAPGSPSAVEFAMDRTADAIVSEAARIRNSLRDESRTSVPCVIGGASRLQELISDLLGAVHSLQGIGDGSIERRSLSTTVMVDAMG
ncbi:MAG: diguanylate cyclase [Planctomycetes bacterium]|nr:diguanylate cyclase [Planctomycetota bacterium]